MQLSIRHPAGRDSSSLASRPKNAKSIRTTFTVITAALILGACGGGGGSDAEADAADAAATTETIHQVYADVDGNGQTSGNNSTDNSTASSSGSGSNSLNQSEASADAPDNQSTESDAGDTASPPPATQAPEPEQQPEASKEAEQEKQPEPVVVPNTINSVQTIMNDMGLSNDAALLGIPDFDWAVNPLPAQLSMGADPRGCIAHSWWQNASAVLPEYKDCDYWTGYVQWFVVFEGEGNAANNVRVETRNPQSWYLSRTTGQWILMGEATNTGWFYATKSNVMWVPGEIDIYTGAGGSTVMRVDRNHPYTYHGVWPLGKIDTSAYVHDIAAIYTTVQARLVLDNATGPDDRANAVWLLQSGADYYPYPTADASNTLPPGVGLSRSKKITSEWQAFNFATTDNARKDYQGPNHGLSQWQLEQNPPPLQ